jgi:hypothetical protein
MQDGMSTMGMMKKDSAGMPMSSQHEMLKKRMDMMLMLMQAMLDRQSAQDHTAEKYRPLAMEGMMDNNAHAHGRRPFWKSRSAIGLLVFGLIALFLMLSEHRAHFLGVLPYLLLFSCPLMHLFMHHGHAHGHQSHPEGPALRKSGDGHEQHR